MSDLNLPGLFRNAYHGAVSRGRKQTVILIPNSQKDLYIKSMSDTRFNQEHGTGKVFPIPNTIQISDVKIHIYPADIPEGVEVIV